MEEVENEKNLNRKKFEEEYENQEKELVERICKKIINPVKGAVKTYYSSSEEVRNRMCMHAIKTQLSLEETGYMKRMHKMFI